MAVLFLRYCTCLAGVIFGCFLAVLFLQYCTVFDCVMPEFLALHLGDWL